MADNTISFYDAHLPVLQDGDYEVTVNQKLTVKDGNHSTPITDIAEKNIKFKVAGPRFQLETKEVVSHYPPSGGKGDYMSVLPTLTLKRNTLPWERSPLKNDASADDTAPLKNSSWLFLLLVDESESQLMVEHNAQALSDLATIFASEATGKVPLSDDDLAHLPEKINYLEMDSSLSGLIPQSLEELQYLSYTRIKKSNEHNPYDDGEEHAVLLCNRLPKRGSTSTVYLVSIENNFVQSGSTISFNGIKITNGKFVFPYLYKWQFYAFDEQLFVITDQIATKIKNTFNAATPKLDAVDFGSIYDQLFENTSDFMDALGKAPFSLKEDDQRIKIIKQLSKLPGSTFHELLTHASFGPLTSDMQSTDLQLTGSQKLGYKGIQNGHAQKLSAWYRGPLAATSIDLNQLNPKFPLNRDGSIPAQPQDLVINDSKNQITDQSYAAAFELGRLMALDDADFSKEFFQWKNEVAMALRLKELKKKDGYKNIFHLPLSDAPQVRDMPAHVTAKFDSWKRLEGIPYRYLVSDPTLIPEECIRFFQMDKNWINAFVLGAFSIGHTVDADLTDYLIGKEPTDTDTKEIKGIRELTFYYQTRMAYYYKRL